MADSPIRARFPALLVATGLIGATSLPTLAQDTVYVGGTGDSVELNLDVLDGLGSPPTVPGMLRFDIQQGQAASGMPLPLPGETRAKVSTGAPLPPPSRATQTRRVTTATPALRSPAAPATPRPATPRVTTNTASSRAALPTRVAGAVPAAPKVAQSAAPKIAAPAKVSIPAPAPVAPSSRAPSQQNSLPKVNIPAPPSSVTGTRAVTPPAPPKIAAPAVTAPTTSAPSVKTPAVSAPKASKPRATQETQVATAAPTAPASAPKISGDGLRIPFEATSKSLPASASAQLDEVAKQMETNDKLRAQLLAYASDADGRSSADARRLSLSRGLAVRSYLIGKGIASTRMDVRILGNKASGEPRDRVDLTLVTR